MGPGKVTTTGGGKMMTRESGQATTQGSLLLAARGWGHLASQGVADASCSEAIARLGGAPGIHSQNKQKAVSQVRGVPRARSSGTLEYSIKAYTTPDSSIHFSCLIRPGEQVCLHPTDMSCYDLSPPTPCGPTPLANSCNEPCVRQCQDSTVLIQPSPVVVTLPGPILSSFPQNTTVGSSASAAVGSALGAEGVPISSGSSSGFGSFGYPGLGSGFSLPFRRYNAFRSGFSGPY
ncbi:uncharacterized protein LOC112994532 isoform X1 [Dromaius novaehollandiae]